jgi:hypothetical protein
MVAAHCSSKSVVVARTWV